MINGGMLKRETKTMIKIKNFIPQKNPPHFSKMLRHFFDEIIPKYVKSTYLPDKKTINKEKPFTQKDARFFAKGVYELSSAFTENRSQSFFNAQKNYFGHPKYRSSYLLYFLPLHFTKFYILFDKHFTKKEIAKIENSTIRILDCGAGPGTASFAFLLWIIENRIKVKNIEFTWVDNNQNIMEDGKKILEIFKAAHTYCPEVEIETQMGSFHTYMKKTKNRFNLILCGNVLNESQNSDNLMSELLGLLDINSLGVLMIEPATKNTSQLLTKMRAHALLPSEDKNSTLIGPCLHEGACPLSQGKDWCHFSTLFEIDAQWFTFFSKGLGSIREWVKYSYLWMNTKTESNKTNTQENKDLRLVISNPLIPTKGGASTLLLCEPERPLRVSLPKNKRSFRGDQVSIEST